METTSTNSSSPYQALRAWGLVFSVGLTLVCLIAFICTCTIKMPIIEDGFTIGTRTIFNPVSLIYLFSSIPSLAFGSLFSAVARIGDDLRAVRASQGRNSEEPTTGENTPAKADDNSTTLLIIAGVITVLIVVFVAAFGVFK
jgi:hypothetical protein